MNSNEEPRMDRREMGIKTAKLATSGYLGIQAAIRGLAATSLSFFGGCETKEEKQRERDQYAQEMTKIKDSLGEKAFQNVFKSASTWMSEKAINDFLERSGQIRTREEAGEDTGNEWLRLLWEIQGRIEMAARYEIEIKTKSPVSIKEEQDYIKGNASMTQTYQMVSNYIEVYMKLIEVYIHYLPGEYWDIDEARAKFEPVKAEFEQILGTYN